MRYFKSVIQKLSLQKQLFVEVLLVYTGFECQPDSVVPLGFLCFLGMDVFELCKQCLLWSEQARRRCWLQVSKKKEFERFEEFIYVDLEEGEFSRSIYLIKQLHFINGFFS